MREETIIKFTFLFTIVLIICGVYMYAQYQKSHRCDQPYTEVCIDYHTETRLVPIPGGAGLKVGKIRMAPRPVKVCDIYELQLKEGCDEK